MDRAESGGKDVGSGLERNEIQANSQRGGVKTVSQGKRSPEAEPWPGEVPVRGTEHGVVSMAIWGACQEASCLCWKCPHHKAASGTDPKGDGVG